MLVTYSYRMAPDSRNGSSVDIRYFAAVDAETDVTNAELVAMLLEKLQDIQNRNRQDQEWASRDIRGKILVPGKTYDGMTIRLAYSYNGDTGVVLVSKPRSRLLWTYEGRYNVSTGECLPDDWRRGGMKTPSKIT